MAELVRTRPVRAGLIVGLPAFVAAVQLVNSYVNDLSLLVSVPFAVVMVAFSGLLLRYQLAQFQLARLESETFSLGAD